MLLVYSVTHLPGPYPAKIAAEYFVDLYAEQTYSDILLEEVEYDDDGNSWSITLGYSIPNPADSLPLALKLPGHRKYKVFKIDAETGNVRSMKIRSLENA